MTQKNTICRKLWKITIKKYNLPKMSANDKKKFQFAEKIGKRQKKVNVQVFRRRQTRRAGIIEQHFLGQTHWDRFTLLQKDPDFDRLLFS